MNEHLTITEISADRFITMFQLNLNAIKYCILVKNIDTIKRMKKLKNDTSK